MKVYTVELDPRAIKLLEVNARYMKHEDFVQLTENIRRDGVLSSAPFLWKDPADDRYLCLSGNHRTMAAIDAGLQTITCLATDDPLTEDQKIAIQLSHNSLSGQDDIATLKLLYEQILDTESKKYSGLDDKTLELMDKFSMLSLSEANLKFQTLSMVFLPDDLNDAQKVIDEAKERAKSADRVWLARMADYDAWLDAQEAVSSSYNVKNVATAVSLMLNVLSRNMTLLAEGWIETAADKAWVPIESVIGRNKIPAATAKVIRKALDRMVGKQEISSKELWKGLEAMAESYISGK